MCLEEHHEERKGVEGGWFYKLHCTYLQRLLSVLTGPSLACVTHMVLIKGFLRARDKGEES